MARVETPSKARFPWRALLYGVILLYLFSDLYWLGGPLRQKIDSRKPFTKYSKEQARKNGWVATVNGDPVTRSQLDRAMDLYFYRRGKSRDAASALDRRLARLAALRELVRDTLVRQHSKAEGFQAEPEAVARHIQAFESQFATPEDLEERSRQQGLSPEERRELLAADAAGKLWLDMRVSPATGVTEAEAREWFEDNREGGGGFQVPARVRARQIFLSTVTEDTPEKEKLIREIHRQISAGEADFATLASELSEDGRSRARGGDLNWFSADRMPEDFSRAVFGLKEGELRAPFRTAIGWHLVEVTERREAREASFEELKPEILAALETDRRRHAIEVFLRKLETASAIEIFQELLENEGAALKEGSEN